MEKDIYFDLRGVVKDSYISSKLPKVILDILPNNKNCEILDIGCGLGQYLYGLQKLGYSNCKGIDKSADAVQYCRTQGLNVELVTDVAEYTNPIGNKYDFIVMTHVLEHIEKNKIISTLIYIRERLLTEEGALLLAVPNAQSNTGVYWYFEDFTHNFLFTTGSLLYVLKASGFNTIKFLDSYQLEESKSVIKRFAKRFFLKIYIFNKMFWNKVTTSSYHRPSPMIFSYELLCLAKK